MAPALFAALLLSIGCTGSLEGSGSNAEGSGGSAPVTATGGFTSGSDGAQGTGGENSATSGDSTGGDGGDSTGVGGTPSTSSGGDTGGGGTSGSGGNPTFPLRVGPSGRMLIDGNDRPFLVNGDSPWYLMTQLTKDEAELYLENRRQKGFNAIVLEMIVAPRGDQPPSNNRDGELPFLSPGDFSTPNEAYFAHVDWVLAKAKEKGFLVFLAPCWMGYGGGSDGWWQEIISNGPTVAREFGRYLGSRFRELDNIVWVHGGDYDAPSGSEGEINGLEILQGIEDEMPSALHTFHRARNATAVEQTTFAPYLDLDATYSGDLTYVEAMQAYSETNNQPHFLIEGRYEGTEWWNGRVNSPEIVRAGAYWSVLSGSTGHVFGSVPLFDFGFRGDDWQAALDGGGSRDIERLGAFFRNQALGELVPDVDQSIVTAGYGDVGSSDYVAAARNVDGTAILAYVASTGVESRTITVNAAALRGTPSASWFNPTDATSQAIEGTISGSQELTTPGDNGTGTNDWVLVVSTAR